MVNVANKLSVTVLNVFMLSVVSPFPVPTLWFILLPRQWRREFYDIRHLDGGDGVVVSEDRLVAVAKVQTPNFDVL